MREFLTSFPYFFFPFVCAFFSPFFYACNGGTFKNFETATDLGGLIVLNLTEKVYAKNPRAGLRSVRILQPPLNPYRTLRNPLRMLHYPISSLYNIQFRRLGFSES